MEYDPNNLTLIDDLRRLQRISEAEKKLNQMQEGLKKLDSKLTMNDMEFIETRRNCTSYYSYNGRIYGCYNGSQWHIESEFCEFLAGAAYLVNDTPRALWAWIKKFIVKCLKT